MGLLNQKRMKDAADKAKSFGNQRNPGVYAMVYDKVEPKTTNAGDPSVVLHMKDVDTNLGLRDVQEWITFNGNSDISEQKLMKRLWAAGAIPDGSELPKSVLDPDTIEGVAQALGKLLIGKQVKVAMKGRDRLYRKDGDVKVVRDTNVYFTGNINEDLHFDKVGEIDPLSTSEQAELDAYLAARGQAAPAKASEPRTQGNVAGGDDDLGSASLDDLGTSKPQSQPAQQVRTVRTRTAPAEPQAPPPGTDDDLSLDSATTAAAPASSDDDDL